MHIDQLEKQVEWLDKERRKDKKTIAGLQKQIVQLEEMLDKSTHDLAINSVERRKRVFDSEERVMSTGNMEINRHPVSMAEFPALLAREKESTRSLTLIIRTDKGTRHGLVLDLMEIAKRVGIEKIVLATEKKEKG